MDSELARQYHINRSTVHAIRSGERWKDVVPHAPANAEQLYTTLRERQADPRKLTRREVAHIKYLLQRGVKVQELAHKYGVPHSAISKIKSGARWPDVLPCAPDAIQLILLGEQEGSK
jgi:DNA-binding Xre family transcriptional regulator